MKLTHLAGAFTLALAFALIPPEAYAAVVAAAPVEAERAPSIVNIPWGAYASEIIIAAGGVASWLIGRSIGLLPGPAKWAIEVTKLDQVGRRVIEQAAFDLAKDIQGKGYTVDVRNAMLAKAINGFQIQAANLYKKFQDTIELKLKARIEEYIAEKRAEAG